MAFVDNDIDGVDDTFDKCLNTSFDDIVDINGCPINKQYYGNINLEFEYDIQKNQTTTNTIKSLYIDYTYNNYLMNLQNSIYTINSQNYTGDFYFNLGYNFDYEKYILKTYLGMKIATASSNVSTQQNDYMISIEYMNIVSNTLIFNSSLKYNITGNSSTSNNKDFINYSLALSYIKNNFNTQISYLNSGDINTMINEYKSIDLSSKYQINKQYYISVGFTKSIITNDSYDTYIDFGISFE